MVALAFRPGLLGRLALRLTIPGILLLVGSGCFLDPSIRRNQVRRDAFDHFTQGLDAESKGDYTRALDLYLKAIEQSPRAAFYYHAGVCQARLGRDDQALNYFDKALAMQPDYEVARAERELLLQRASLQSTSDVSTDTPDTRSAQSPTTTALTQSAAAATVPFPFPNPKPTSGLPPPEEVRAIVFPEIYGEKSEGPSPALTRPETKPTLPEFHLPPTEIDQALLASEAGRLDQAAYYLEGEIRENPEDWNLRLRLARVLARSGRLSRAETELREAARRAPNSPEIWYEWGGFYVRQENWVEAERCYRECLRIDPGQPRARNNLGVVLLKIGFWEQAEEQFQLLVDKDPAFASPYLNLAIIEAQYRDDLDRAIAYAEDYVRYQGARTEEVRRWRQNLLLRKGSLPNPETP